MIDLDSTLSCVALERLVRYKSIAKEQGEPVSMKVLNINFFDGVHTIGSTFQ